MEIVGHFILCAGLVFVVIGTLRSIIAHTVIATLHFMTIADTLGLIFIVVSAFFFG